MVEKNGKIRQNMIDRLCAYIKKKSPKQDLKLIKVFAERYYASVSIEDIEEHQPNDLFGAFLSHWNWMYQRAPGESKVRIFNPTVEKDGWQSDHTIVEVSHDDAPFLVDSLWMAFSRQAVQVHFTIHFGGLHLVRNAAHRIVEVLPMGASSPKASTEAPIFFEIDRQNDPLIMQKLNDHIQQVLTDVRFAVHDWKKIVAQMEDVLLELEKNKSLPDAAELAESKDFLRWLINKHFTFLGCRDYKITGKGASRALQLVPKTGLGVLRDESGSVLSRSYADLPLQARKQALSQNILIIAKTNTKATVHRDVYTDYIGVKRFNAKGELIGERRFVGLYTSAAYHLSPRYIPFLRHKVDKVLSELQYPADSHDGKEAVHILETLPRDDLFQATQEELLELTIGILQLQERKRVRLFLRKDAYNRYFSCLVYVPRDIFTTDLCLLMQDVLMYALQGVESSFTTYFSDSVLARVHFLLRVDPKKSIDYDVPNLEKTLVGIARSWVDELRTHLADAFGEAEGLQLYNKYHKAFPSSYSEYYLPSTAIDDIRKIETLTPTDPLGMIFYKTGKTGLRLKLFHSEHAIALSDVLPTLENMGLRINGERPHEIIFRDGSVVLD